MITILFFTSINTYSFTRSLSTTVFLARLPYTTYGIKRPTKRKTTAIRIIGTNDRTVGIWRTLSKEEWEYLIETRTMTNGKARYSIPGHGVTIGSTTYNGLFLYPENYNGEVVSGSMTWDDINAAGIVFLPAAGCYGSGYVARDESEGFYWSSSAYSEYSSYLMYFQNTGNVTPDKGDDGDDECKREKNYSVRLVTEVK